MGNVRGFTRSQALYSVVAVCAAGLLMALPAAVGMPPKPLAPGCDTPAFPPTFLVTQSDGWTVDLPAASGTKLQGTATAKSPSGETLLGRVSGGLTGEDKISFIVNWDNGHRSKYFGNVDPDGAISGGRQDLRPDGGPDHTNWRASLVILCNKIAPNEQPPPPEPQPNPQPEPKPPTVLGTLEVLIPTDVWDAPDGKGKKVGVSLTFGRDVQIIGEGCRDGWCNVAVPEAPGGVGWVFQLHFRRL